MPTDIRSILRLQVPLIVVIGQRRMKLENVLQLGPGSIIELPKNADDDLQVLVNNKAIAHGSAVKVGENYGVRIKRVGPLSDRIKAMGYTSGTVAPSNGGNDATASDAEADAENLTQQVLAGQ